MVACTAVDNESTTGMSDDVGLSVTRQRTRATTATTSTDHSAGMAASASASTPRRAWVVSFEQKIAPPPADPDTGNPIPVHLRPVSYFSDGVDGVEFVYGTGEANYPLLDPIGDLVLPLLRFPNAVGFEVRVSAPEGEGAVEKAVAVVDVKVVDTDLFGPPASDTTASILQRLGELAAKAREETRRRYRVPFDIETDVEIVQPAGSYCLKNYNVGSLHTSPTACGDGSAAVTILSATATGPTTYRVPAPFPRFNELMEQLLRLREVKFEVRTYIPAGGAITKAMLVVKLQQDSNPPAALIELFDASSLARCRQRQQDETRPRSSTVEPPLEILPMVR